MTYNVIIDEAACIAQGDCQETAPESFTVTDAARFTGAGDDDRVLDAAAACPTSAITIIDADTDRQLFP
jgi:ferredoxin